MSNQIRGALMTVQMQIFIGKRWLVPSLVFAWLVVCSTHFAMAQGDFPKKLTNPGVEEANESGAPAGWMFAGPSGRTVKTDEENPFAGVSSALIDATQIADGTDNSSFANLMQVLDGNPYRGKRVRFRAAVRTAELERGKAQLWFRVDRQSTNKNGQPEIGAFDNMQNRPIMGDSWQHHEIVLQVDDDAQRIIIGLLLIGKGKAWLDDVSIEIVDDATPTTGANLTAAPNRSAPEAVNPQQALANAFSQAEHAPQQPFFVSWLWLAVVALVLFGMSQYVSPHADGQSIGPTPLGFLPKFGLRFSVAYWLLYSLPAPFVSVLPFIGNQISQLHASWVDQAVRWTALRVLGLEQVLVAPHGSGDTTYSYVNVLLCFVLAIAVAIVWTLIDRRRTDYRVSKDLLRSYLRYVLAFTLLSYGLAKVGSVYNQFPEVGTYQLTKTYGDSSPMNLLWTFMGASRPYTMFAGLGEVVGALLLIWRRTTVLGAMVAFGVMFNVMMMNFCYDVPVKQYSIHLVCMALYLLLPEAGRLSNVLLWNRPTNPANLLPPYAGLRTIWVQRVVKAALILMGICMPVYRTISLEWQHTKKPIDPPGFFGWYEVDEYKCNGEIVPPVITDLSVWRKIALEREPNIMGGGTGTKDTLTINLMGSGVLWADVKISDDQKTLTVNNFGSVVVPSELKVSQPDDQTLLLTGKIARGEIEVKLRRRGQDKYLLTGRGFRWINEVPFNR